MKIKIAAAQYPIDFLKDWSAYQQKTKLWVTDAVEQQAQLLMFPEYASIELTSLFAPSIYASLSKQLSALQELLPDYLQLYSDLAVRHDCYILAGSFPVKVRSGKYRNRAYLFYPDGRYDFQEKIQMTRFEHEHWLIEGGDQIKIFDSPFGKFAINICYDSEFPLFARQAAEASAQLLLVPSCTDTLAGYHRVRIGCQARALENQFYVVQSSTVLNAPWSKTVDVNIGAAAVYTPVDQGFPENGILAMGELNQKQWLITELDLAKTDQIRKSGQVLNYRDWQGQYDKAIKVNPSVPHP